MRRGSTTTHIFNIDIVLRSPRAVQITYRQGNYFLLQKQLEDITYEIVQDEEQQDIGVKITVVLSQEETMKFNSSDFALIQVRIISADNVSFVSTIEKIKVQECLDCNILPLEE